MNSSLWDYSDACLLFKGTTTVAGQGVDSADNNDKQVMFKNCTVQRLYKQNNTQVDNTKDLPLVMPVYNLM